MAAPDADRIKAALRDDARQLVDAVHAFGEIDSTNNFLRDQPPPKAGRAAAAVADHQTAGRGRNERKWLSAPDKSLCLSVAYSFADEPVQLPPLTLAAGVGVVRALGHFGVHDVKLKWPNDLVLDDGKLGGILTEAQMRPGGRVTVVIGVGLNLLPAESIEAAVDDSWVQAVTALGGAASSIDRDQLAAELVNELVDVLRTYDTHGFEEFTAAFDAIDWLRDRPITVSLPEGDVDGVAAGIDAEGALQLDAAGEIRTIVSGTISRVGEAADTDT
ncbi:MAG: biotin--[acetyl-CoA-carboxylase] ligase [Woeseiaceae bacterium]|nr:biotin--[acetyl-CoA-carboxylase] ligase [Woeseiaceae bacterium]